MTHIKQPDFPFKVTYSDTLLSLGSCFAVNMATKLDDLGYRVLRNPAGITFNPASLSRTIKMVKNPDSLHKTPSTQQAELWSHPDFHGSFNNPDRQSHLEMMEGSLKDAHEAISKVSVVLITMGTAHVYVSKESGNIVNNCHKKPADHFDKRLMTIQEIKESLYEIKKTVDELSIQEVNFVISVSPVRHVKNGLVSDRHSKSLLLVACHEFVQEQASVHYFPAYEILVDELRDYRYYADDLIHPSTVAVDHVFECFEQNLLDKKESEVRTKVSDLIQRQNHRPLFPETEAHQKFLKKLKSDKVLLLEKYPFLDL